METQNITLAIPKDILRKAKIMAVKRNTSLSALLTQTLEDLVSDEEGFEQARLQPGKNETGLQSGHKRSNNLEA